MSSRDATNPSRSRMSKSPGPLISGVLRHEAESQNEDSGNTSGHDDERLQFRTGPEDNEMVQFFDQQWRRSKVEVKSLIIVFGPC
jgi:hypothetical protein